MTATTYMDKALAPFRPVIHDDIVEICVNPDGMVWTESRGDGHMIASRVTLTAKQAEEAVAQMAGEGKLRVSKDKPLGTVSFDYGPWMIRAQLLLPPVVRGQHAFSMRFFRPETEGFEPAYLEGRSMSVSERRLKLTDDIAEQAKDDLQGALRAAVQAKLNIIVSGGTSSGKTTLARWLVEQVDDSERILTIEDVPDLLPKQPNNVMMVSKRSSDVRTPDHLLQASLRLRPDRIILSEVTGSDAYTFLKAINTGHGGSITTVHADTAELAIERMAQTALEAPGKMTYKDMVAYVVRSIDIIVQTGKSKDRRGVMEVYLPRNYEIEDIGV